MTAHVLGSEPYAWPYDGRIGGAHVALVLAGWDEGWKGRAADNGAPNQRCEELAAAVASIGGTVFVLAHGGSPALPVTSASASVVAVPAVDGFYGTPLDAALRVAGLTHLLVAGHGMEAAVHSTLRSANDRGYECLLITDACSLLDPELGEASVKTVTMSGGIFGAIGCTQAVLDVLAEIDPIPTPVTA